MVEPVIRKPWFRMFINGAAQNISSEYTQNESLTDSVTRVLQADVIDTPTLSTGQSIALQAIDAQSLTTIDQFSGTLNTVTAARFPHQVSLVCTGPLAKLRRTRLTDLDLSGQTDEQAAKTILSYCGISYLDANIGGNGYVLGQRVPIIWAAGQSGAEIMAELNRVFAYALIEVGNGTVCRISYDLVPSLSDSVKTFHAGNSYFYHDGSRVRGDIDAIQNIWDVTGASYECPGSTTDEKCTCAIWAHAEATHPKLGAGVYARAQTFSSEIIQDANLARGIATRQMRWYNREPDNIVIETYNDPTMSPGRVVSIIDSVYGMDFSTATPYLVTRLDRRGDFMTLNCVGGAAGSTGTVTSGVEKKCNDLSVNLPDPPDLGEFPGFEPPEFPPFPPIDTDPDFPDWPGIDQPWTPDSPGLPGFPEGFNPPLPGGFTGPASTPPSPDEPPGFDPCVTDDDCPEGSVCAGGFCMPVDCQTDGDCPSDATCMDGHCVPTVCRDACEDLTPNAREVCYMECVEEECEDECMGLTPNAREACIMECRDEKDPYTQVVELACDDWTDSLSQGSIDCPIINDDTTIVFGGAPSESGPNEYTDTYYSPPIAEYGDSFRLTYVVQAGPTPCNLSSNSVSEAEIGFCLTLDPSTGSWGASKAVAGTIGWGEDGHMFQTYYFGAGDYIIQPWPGPGESEPWTLTWTYIHDTDTVTCRFSQGGDTLWTYTEGPYLQTKPYFTSGTPIYAMLRTPCGDITLLHMSVEVW